MPWQRVGDPSDRTFQNMDSQQVYVIDCSPLRFERDAYVTTSLLVDEIVKSLNAAEKLRESKPA